LRAATGSSVGWNAGRGNGSSIRIVVFGYSWPSRSTLMVILETRSRATQMNVSAIKQASALIPVVMSLAALGLVIGHALMFGIVHEADEGTPAHIFQILMAAQVPVVLYFAAKWLPRAPRQALLVLALQAGAGLAAFASVYFLT
jgi:hypothetical protein